MAARQVTVAYEDGEPVTIALKPKHLIMAERLLNKPISEHAVEATYIAAWKAVRSPLKFDDWLDTVEHIEEHVDDEDESADPTPAAESLDE